MQAELRDLNFSLFYKISPFFSENKIVLFIIDSL